MTDDCDDCFHCSRLTRLAQLIPVGRKLNRAVIMMIRNGKKSKQFASDWGTMEETEWLETCGHKPEIRRILTELVIDAYEDNDELLTYHKGNLICIISHVAKAVYVLTVEHLRPDEEPEVCENPKAEE
jgi:mRNA degradation ribonuclease J1/J2